MLEGVTTDCTVEDVEDGDIVPVKRNRYTVGEENADKWNCGCVVRVGKKP